MAPALLAPPPDSQPEFRAIKFPVRPADVRPVLVATFDEAWERLEKLSRRDDRIPYIQQLKYGIAAVNNLVRISEDMLTASSDPGAVTAEVQATHARQKAFAVKQTDDVLKIANAQILAAPPGTEGKFPMVEIVHSLMLVKSRADHSPAHCRSLFLKVLGKLVTELPL